MSQLIAIPIRTGAGAPKNDATPVITVYKDLAAVNQAAPADPVLVSAGSYETTAPTGDVTGQRVALVTCGSGCVPDFYAIGIGLDSDPFAVVLLLDNAGALWSGAAPTWSGGFYKDRAGADRSPPALLPIVAPYLYAFKPSSGDLSVGVCFRLVSPAGANPIDFSGTFEATGALDLSVPVVSNWFPNDPPSAGSIAPGSVIGFDVTCTAGFSNIMITCGFLGLELREEVFDGYAFTPLYATGTKTTIADGFQFRFSRKGGFPFDPLIKIRAVSANGKENA